MAFDLTPDLVADELAPFLGERPTIAPVDGCIVVTAPLPLSVVISRADVPDHFDVRCYQRIDGLSVGIAYLAANEASFDSSSGARARVLPSGDHLVVLIENGVCGPILAGQDFAVAIRTVLDGVEAFQRSVGRFLIMQDALRAMEQEWGMVGPEAAPVPLREVSTGDALDSARSSDAREGPVGSEPEADPASVSAVDEAAAQRFETPGYL
jgi:hypothetical protein